MSDICLPAAEGGEKSTVRFPPRAYISPHRRKQFLPFQTTGKEAPQIKGYSQFDYSDSPDCTPDMNYQSYVESPQGLASNTRQAPSPGQNMNHTNGINGNAVGLPGVVAGLPTPAGHQSDLNHIYNMVEELSRALEENRQATARIVAASGQVRQRAMEQTMTTEEVITSVADELNSKSQHLLSHFL